ncbi:UDP-glycosyltransferase UGT4 [Dendroctonus ponderosae]|uniref:UDP-glycosyltransferase n=1 Tax=Dendroctonus ponderosae TaxID=77166 RepID=U4UE47_DENPD|nr:UDP-glycosyltransferase UGT4 [Dendroctonus ponderosae]XP_019762234.2 UDP-glycosyltransferase UGT4 [Dendroctonus ponderosae]ERL88841.1 hypothetical protein D910_06223 [Dendroctonus ponderosae]
MKLWTLLSFVAAYQQVLLAESNILVVFPHVYYSHFKETARLVSKIGTYGYNVTFVTPFPTQLENAHQGITEISIEGIVEPLKDYVANFYQTENTWYSYWSHLKYTKDIGYEYAQKVLENENVTKLISSSSQFDLVIIEDVSADALTILSHIFKCPLVVLLSEPLGIFYDNYVTDITPWKQYNEIRSMHHWAFKELFRELNTLPAQNRLARKFLPSAPDLRNIMYDTSLVLMPSYEILTYLVPKYPHVKQIGGFNRAESNKPEIEAENASASLVVVSKNIPSYIFEKLLDIPSLKFIYTSQVSDVIRQERVDLLIGDGDVYDIASAMARRVKVLIISRNYWHQSFLIDKLVDERMALQVSIEDDFKKIVEAVNYLMNDAESVFKVMRAWTLMNIEQPEGDQTMGWLEHVLFYKGASHLRPSNLRSSLLHNRITVIIILIIVDLALFLLFYWIIIHFHKVLRHAVLKVCGAIRRFIKRRAQPQTTISYIPIDEKKFGI